MERRPRVVTPAPWWLIVKGAETVRLRAEIWVKAYLRSCENGGASVFVVRHGDDDAGAVFIKVRGGGSHTRLYGPAPAGLDDMSTERRWVEIIPPRIRAEPDDTEPANDEKPAHLDASDRPVALELSSPDEADIDAYLAQQYAFDRDIWVVEVADRDGRHFLDDWLAR